jgi:DNA-binding XRE family transcriptional regulator
LMTAEIVKIRHALTAGEIQKAALAMEAGLHRNSLVDVESDEWNPRYKTVLALCAAVDRIKARRA